MSDGIRCRQATPTYRRTGKIASVVSFIQNPEDHSQDIQPPILVSNLPEKYILPHPVSLVSIVFSSPPPYSKHFY
jgi:hypothetical protein